MAMRVPVAMSVMAMMPAVPTAHRVAMMIMFAGMAVFAGRTFIQREFVAHANIDFAHSYSLQNAALLAVSSIYHQIFNTMAVSQFEFLAV
jgi:hypothetical protein